MLYKNLIRPLLFLGDPEKTHEQTLALLSKIESFEGVLERLFSVQDDRLRVQGWFPYLSQSGGTGGRFRQERYRSKNHSRVWFWFPRDRGCNGIGATGQSQTAALPFA